MADIDRVDFNSKRLMLTDRETEQGEEVNEGKKKVRKYQKGLFLV